MPKMPAPKKLKTSLAPLKNSAKGSIHHMEIHPAKNSKGGQAFLTKLFRNRPPAQQAAYDQGGSYSPPPQPDETQHPNQADMVSHVQKAFGGQPQAPAMPENDGDADDQQAPPEPA